MFVQIWLHKLSAAMPKIWALICVLYFFTPLKLHSQRNSRYDLAISYENSGDIKNAARIYKELYDNDNGSNQLFEDVYRTYSQLKLYSELLPIVRVRSQERQKDFTLKLRLADLYFRNNSKDSAKVILENSISLEPTNPDNYKQVGEIYFINFQFDEAIKILNKGIAYSNSKGDFYDLIARNYANKKEYDLAVENYLLVLNEKVSYQNYLISEFSQFSNQENFLKTAIKKINSELDNTNKNVKYISACSEILIWLYSEKGDYDECLNAAIILDKKIKGAGTKVFAYGDKMQREGRYNQAYRAFEYLTTEYNKSNPLYKVAALNLIDCSEKLFLSSGNNLDSIKLIIKKYEQIVEQNEEEFVAAEALLHIGKLGLVDKKFQEKAISCLEKIREKYPKSEQLKESLILLADLNLLNNDTAKATRYYNEVIIQTGKYNSEEKEIYYQAKYKKTQLLYFQLRYDEALAGFEEIEKNLDNDFANDAIEKKNLIQENLNIDKEGLNSFAKSEYELFKQNYDTAINGLKACFANAKTNELKYLSLKKIIDIFIIQKKYDSVFIVSENILDEKKFYQYADEVYFKLGELSEKELNKKEEAMKYYLFILTEYPKSALLPKAAKRVRALRGDKVN